MSEAAVERHRSSSARQAALSPDVGTAPALVSRTKQRRWSLAITLLTMGVAGPALLFPMVRPTLTMGAVTLVLVGHVALAAVSGSLWPRSRLDAGIAALGLGAGISAWTSRRPDLALPKVSSLLLGLYAYQAVLRLVRGRRDLVSAVIGCAAIALLMASLAMVAGLRPAKVPAIGRLLVHLPVLTDDLPEAQYGKVSMNQAAGALSLVLPIVAAGALVPVGDGRHRPVPGIGVRVLLAAATMALAAVVVLAQSRSAWAGLITGAAVLVGLRWRRGRWVLLGVALVALAVTVLWGHPTIAAILRDHVYSDPMANGSVAVSFNGRVTIWRQTLDMLPSCLWTGCGLGSFRALRAMHTHNVVLQVIYDTGLIGAIGYALLVGAAVCSSFGATSSRDPVLRTLGAGALASLTAYHVYGIFDVVALGAKPGILMWLLLAIIAAGDRLRHRYHVGSERAGPAPDVAAESQS